jgi:hypothetical protein
MKPFLIIALVTVSLFMAASAQAGPRDVRMINKAPKVTVVSACVIGGCGGSICTDRATPPPLMRCKLTREQHCFKTLGNCRVQANGHCGWTNTPEIAQCLADAKYNQSRKKLRDRTTH